MKNKVILFIGLFLIGGSCLGQVMFQRVITMNSYSSSANAVQQTADGGYILAGSGRTTLGNDPPFSADAYLIKTNSLGDIVWTRSYGDTANAYNAYSGYSVQQTFDGGYIMAGDLHDWSGVNGGEYSYVVKTNANGDTLWTKKYSVGRIAGGGLIQQTSDSGYIMVGQAYDSVAQVFPVYLLKINALGDIIWAKTYMNTATDYDAGNGVKQTSDGGYIICCYHTGDLIKTNSSGDTLWTKAYVDTNGNQGVSVQQTFDGGYIVAGNTNYDIYVIKTNQYGDTLWTKTYGSPGDDYANAIEQTSDSGYIILVSTSDNSSGNDVYLIKTNAFGDTLWTVAYNGLPGSSVWQTTDGGYIMPGFRATPDSSIESGGISLIKTDANGNSGCLQGNTNIIIKHTAINVSATSSILGSLGAASPTFTIVGSGGTDSALCLYTGIAEQNINNTTSLFPNPAQNELIIKSTELTIKEIDIYNVLGQKASPPTPLLEARGEATIDVSGLAEGIYFVIIIGENEVWTGKFVKE